LQTLGGTRKVGHAGDAIRLLDSLTCGIDPTVTLLMETLSAAFDDSGSDGLGPVFVLAGYLAGVESWKTFTVEWANELQRPPSIPYLKMKEANSLRGPFWGWSATGRDEKLDRLSDVIVRHVPFGISSTIFWEDWRTVAGKNADVPLVPYDFLYHSTMAVTAQHVIKKFPRKSKVDFVFDDQEGAGTRAAFYYSTIRNWHTSEEREVIAGPPVQRDEKIFLPLQAADMIAWQTRRFVFDNRDACTGLEPTESYILNSPTMRKLQNIPTIYNSFGLDRLRNWVEDFRMHIALFPDESSYVMALNDRNAPLRLRRITPWEKS
jgi:Protein of unknown function (DUF3800)